MARVNKCKTCGCSDPESGWAGTNHNLCVACCPPPATNQIPHRGARPGQMKKLAVLAAVLGFMR